MCPTNASSTSMLILLTSLMIFQECADDTEAAIASIPSLELRMSSSPFSPNSETTPRGSSTFSPSEQTQKPAPLKDKEPEDTGRGMKRKNEEPSNDAEIPEFAMYAPKSSRKLIPPPPKLVNQRAQDYYEIIKHFAFEDPQPSFLFPKLGMIRVNDQTNYLENISDKYFIHDIAEQFDINHATHIINGDERMVLSKTELAPITDDLSSKGTKLG